MDIAQVTGVNTTKGTVSVKVIGARDEYLQDNIPVMQSSPNATVLPKIGDRCVVSNIGGELICMGYLKKETQEVEEENEARDSRPGDFQIGDQDTGMIGNLQGGMLVMMANGTGVMITRDDRIVNIVGDMIGFDTPTVHKTWGNSNGSADIQESIYYALGEISKTSINGDSGDMDINVQRMKNIKFRINGDVLPVELAALGRQLETFEIEVNTAADKKLIIKWDNVLQEFSIEVPGSTTITSEGLLRILAASMGFNCSGTNPLQGLINGTYKCQMTGMPLASTGQQLSTVQGG